MSGNAALPAEPIPQVGESGLAGYDAYRLAAGHKAFAIAPGGAWAWVGETATAGEARDGALERCAARTRQRCLLYALDEAVVFDAEAWAGSWRTVAATAAGAAHEGTGVGERFPDIAFRDSDGQPRRIADFRGRVTLVHFWGSWCPPCMRELPALERLHAVLESELGERYALVMLHVREPLERARRWLARNGLDSLPIHDGAAEGGRFALNGGGYLADRALATFFPTSYVLDPEGRVVFAHLGPIEDWMEYRPLFTALAREAVAQAR